MRSDARVLGALFLNLFFSAVELVGGVLTGSVAILSDALHDLGDALGIGTAYALERKSHRPPDREYTYGYLRYSAVGGLLTNLILLAGSVAVIYRAVLRFFDPNELHARGMILLAILGVGINLAATLLTRHGHSHGERAVSLHMLEDVLGWLAVLVGGVVIELTGLTVLDPILSIAVALFILVEAMRGLFEVLTLLLDKVPRGVFAEELRQKILGIDGVLDVHHIHLRSLDGHIHDATMHIVTTKDTQKIKEAVRALLKEHGFRHATLETESECCDAPDCRLEPQGTEHCHGHNHHR